ncbi:ABC transporter substrate-binding protein [Effusibacillus lacus]|uniref:Branched chain amino acid ABC transporter substrate-binding protein n=1 Tax=Effusibacillus lacus TaxID=1348429 RepID=A0A292YQU7_9BACL|nr:ABC transporter substrate-binding protein [Effusibacillus lacus]TCS72566.1 amino acid/amide ABC transporter substrate-binding protein (HAAT family) [Effusibacillus lacus]GAX90875.1 branched chain amino acid ABC transporter substrate-binding protein [Effusibacillus lacus]
MFRKKFTGVAVASLFLMGSLLSGCGSQQTGSGGKADSVTIGAIFPLTGGSAYQGKSFKQAIELAQEEINAKGGINGLKLNILFEDDKGVPAEGVNAAQKLITQNKVSAILGNFNSSVTLAVRAVTEREKVVQLTPGSTADSITEPGHKYMFRNLMPNSFQGPELAKYATKKLNLKKVAIIAENTDYGRSGAEQYKKTTESLGGKILAVEYYNQGDKDFYAQLTKLKNLNPEGVFIAGLITEGAQILKQARDLGIKTQWLGLGGFTNDKFFELSEGAAEGMIHVSYFEPEAYQYFPQSKEFVENYKKKYGVGPDMYAANSYEAVYILAEAIKTAGGGDREKIREAMSKIKDLPGVCGPTTFDQNGQAAKGLLFVKIQGGKRVPIGSEKDSK